MSSSHSTNGLRFGILVRVSTEKQQKKGESLPTQRAKAQADVARLGGVIVGWYGGAEHATEGYERREVDRLLADAGKGAFNAVYVAHADRWSRDNVKSAQGLDVFKANRVRFFVGGSEFDLYRPEHALFLSMSAAIGAFQAAQQNEKSITNKIARARRGLPTCGRLPFGRTFDARAGWGIDPEKQGYIRDIAQRFLLGESLETIARQKGVSESHLRLLLRDRCGCTWRQEFTSKSLNIHEVVDTPVPALLPPETVRAIRDRLAANKTYTHGQAKHKYLLGRMVFCGHCHAPLFGQTHANGNVHYRHTPGRRIKDCTCPDAAAKVLARDLEQAVFVELFTLFGNPSAVQRAVEAATPNKDKIEEARRRLTGLEDDLGRVKVETKNLVRGIARGTISEEDAAEERADLREREAALLADKERLQATLANVPTKQEVEQVAKRVTRLFRPHVDVKLNLEVDHANSDFDGMSWEDRRALAQMVFAGKTLDGLRRGVYVERAEGMRRKQKNQRWRFHLLGRLVDLKGEAPDTWDAADRAESFAAHLQHWLLETVQEVTKGGPC
jgi:DNA invertase Pin-like site-specific DNA recombinase